MVSTVVDSNLDIASPGLYAYGIPHERFAAIRDTPGLMWHPYEASGFWTVTRHADVLEVSKNPDVYSSAIGHTNLWDLEPDALEARRAILDTDPPEHTRLRRVVSKAFTPRNIRLWEDMTREIAGGLLDDFVGAGGGDWVEQVAAPLPINVILAILGVPREDADYLVEISNYLVEGTGDRQSLPPDAYGNTTDPRLLPFNSPASHALYEYGEQMGEDRRARPRDDLVTHLVFAEAGGQRLTPAEYRNFFHTLVFAGNETTRTALTHGAEALARSPEQWRRVVDDPGLVASAVEEIIRWATPVLHMRRTARVDTSLAGTDIAAGDKVVMWYCAANRDPAVFDEPARFDVGRDPNPHLAFGGGGPHFCLGAFLARMEIQVLLEELIRRDLALTDPGEPVRAPSNFVHGVLSLELGVNHGGHGGRR